MTTTAPDRANASAIVPAKDHAPVVVSRDPEAFAIPVGREEEWRFTPLKRFTGLLAGEASELTLAIDATLADGMVLESGIPSESLPMPVDRISALAAAQAVAITAIRVPARTDVSEPTFITLTGDDTSAATWGHLVIEIGEQSSATIVLEHKGSAHYGEHLDVIIGQAATLNLVHVQSWDADAVHSGHVAIRVGRDAVLRSTQISLGGNAVRMVETVEYAGPGGQAHLNGLFFARDDQHLEHRLFVDHSAPYCTSRVMYKGALSGEGARSVWIGDVLIRAGAVGTDTYEINRNLVLSDGARADSVPNLEIETGEVVGAGHASATGRFDDEQLFYLQARGIPESEARRLVVLGFFADILGRIGVESIASNVLNTVAGTLGAGDERFNFAVMDSAQAQEEQA